MIKALSRPLMSGGYLPFQLGSAQFVLDYFHLDRPCLSALRIGVDPCAPSSDEAHEFCASSVKL